MKTMTEFIMEQEAPTEELLCESFNENELVSQFMALQAASANLDCMFEYATIANFCEANELTMPEKLVQEGFVDSLKSIGKSIADWFKRVIEWFKGIIKGTSTAFAKAKITETIAKFRQYNSADGTKNLSQEMSTKVKYVTYAVEVLWGFLVKFKEVLSASMENLSIAGRTLEQADQEYQRVMADADDINEALKKFTKTTNWIDSNGVIKNEAFTTIAAAADVTTPEVDRNSDTLNAETVIKYLQRVNKYNIPSKGNELLKQLGALDTKFVEVHKDATGNNVESTLKNDPNFEAASKEMTKKIKEMANHLAKAYDEVTKKFADISATAAKDIEVTDKTEYDKAVKKESEESKKKDADDIQ